MTAFCEPNAKKVTLIVVNKTLRQNYSTTEEKVQNNEKFFETKLKWNNFHEKTNRNKSLSIFI